MYLRDMARLWLLAVAFAIAAASNEEMQQAQGFGAHYTIIIIRNPQNGIGNYLGPYIIVPL